MFTEDSLKEMNFLLYSAAGSHVPGREGFPVGPVAGGREWVQDSLIPWPQVTSGTSCWSEEEPKLPRVPSGPRGFSLKASLRKSPREYSWELWLFGQRWLGTVGVVRRGTLWKPRSAAQTPNLGPVKRENKFQIPALYTLLLLHFIQIFLLKRNFKT